MISSFGGWNTAGNTLGSVAEADKVIRGALAGILLSMLPAEDVRIAELTLPWRRSFEIGLVLE